MRAALQAYGDQTRCVWVADSFQGLPKPNAIKYPADAGDKHWRHNDRLGVSLDEVKQNFARYGLLDERVKFLKGWFHETLRGAPIRQLSVLRLDGDMYESTIEVLEALYPKLSVGGFLIVDDYKSIQNCQAAVTDYRRKHDIRDEIVEIDWTGVYWRRSS
jgi:O-methyltransferase